ncbi:MAG: pyruvate kinase [Saprospirales bacterium]|nr:pyruvate kinase [Saprospirales bacterium]
MPLQPSAIDLQALIRDISRIIADLEGREQTYRDLLDRVQPHYLESARNLLHYLTLRTYDLRSIQSQLSTLAISSIGHSEGYTLTNLTNILLMLRLLNGEEILNPLDQMCLPLNYRRSREQLTENTARLLGECTRENCTKIMVTFSTDIADDYDLVRELIHVGMDVARINTAHDGPEEWRRMAGHVRRASAELGRPCMVYMDLAGPKLRTGPVRPVKDDDRPYIRLFKGDRIELMRKKVMGRPGQVSANGRKVSTARISTTIPEIFDDVQIGEAVCFDDGKIRGKVVEIRPKSFMVEVTSTNFNGAKLRADKGINFPDTHIHLPPLTETDLEHLEIIASLADVVGYSFVRKPSDVEFLLNRLRLLGRPDIGLTLKIETKEAFENLPMLLFTAMQCPRIGVMIARGDLAVEIGYERIAEVQEEILWICEAAHIPDIWATQVLDKLARKGIATRAEITDAAMSSRAECVMLNKGPHIVEAVTILDDIVRRMAHHQFKRKSRLRPLGVAKQFWGKMLV